MGVSTVAERKVSLETEHLEDFTRLTAEEAIKQLRAQGFADDVLPSRSGMSKVLNRNGYRLRPVLKAKPQKKSLKPTPFSPTSGNVTAIAKTKPSCA